MPPEPPSHSRTSPPLSCVACHRATAIRETLNGRPSAACATARRRRRCLSLDDDAARLRLHQEGLRVERPLLLYERQRRLFHLPRDLRLAELRRVAVELGVGGDTSDSS